MNSWHIFTLLLNIVTFLLIFFFAIFLARRVMMYLPLIPVKDGARCRISSYLSHHWVHRSPFWPPPFFLPSPLY